MLSPSRSSIKEESQETLRQLLRFIADINLLMAYRYLEDQKLFTGMTTKTGFISVQQMVTHSHVFHLRGQFGSRNIRTQIGILGQMVTLLIRNNNYLFNSHQ